MHSSSIWILYTWIFSLLLISNRIYSSKIFNDQGTLSNQTFTHGTYLVNHIFPWREVVFSSSLVIENADNIDILKKSIKTDIIWHATKNDKLQTLGHIFVHTLRSCCHNELKNH